MVYEKHPKDACPKCGALKGVASRVCRACHAREQAQANRKPGHFSGQTEWDTCECGGPKKVWAERCIVCHRAYVHANRKRHFCGCGKELLHSQAKMCWECRYGSEQRSGWTMDSNGYAWVLMPDHPAANADGYVQRSHLVASASIGRPIAADEVVHHINAVRDDDRPENLVVMNRFDHARMHHPPGMKPAKRPGLTPPDHPH